MYINNISNLKDEEPNMFYQNFYELLEIDLKYYRKMGYNRANDDENLLRGVNLDFATIEHAIEAYDIDHIKKGKVIKIGRFNINPRKLINSLYVVPKSYKNRKNKSFGVELNNYMTDPNEENKEILSHRLRVLCTGELLFGIECSESMTLEDSLKYQPVL